MFSLSMTLNFTDGTEKDINLALQPIDDVDVLSIIGDWLGDRKVSSMVSTMVRLTEREE
jgi:hypothetical protein